MEQLTIFQAIEEAQREAKLREPVGYEIIMESEHVDMCLPCIDSLRRRGRIRRSAESLAALAKEGKRKTLYAGCGAVCEECGTEL